MKPILFLLTFILSVNISTCQGDKSGFTSIFNGKDLSGWTVTEENSNSFLVEDGKLVARGGRAHIFYDGLDGNNDFADFELSLKVMTNAKSNSGVYFQTKYQAESWPGQGFEAQVNAMHSDPRKTGSLYGIVNMWSPEVVVEPFISKVDDKGEVYVLRTSAPNTDGEWFDYYIKVLGNRIIIKVNGEITVDWTQPENYSRKRKIGSGTIGLQAHDPTCEVYYKDIMLKILD